MGQMTAEDVISEFRLLPHPFDGWYARVETSVAHPVRYHYLIRSGEYAAWHRTGGRLVVTHIDGAPLTLTVSDGGRATRSHILHESREHSCMVEDTEWRTWESLGHWSLIIVSAERTAHFLHWSLAPDDWHPEPG